MSTRDTMKHGPASIALHSEEDRMMVRQGDGSRTVVFQWTDGAGELHIWALSPAQSTPFLVLEEAEP